MDKPVSRGRERQSTSASLTLSVASPRRNVTVVAISNVLIAKFSGDCTSAKASEVEEKIVGGTPSFDIVKEKF